MTIVTYAHRPRRSPRRKKAQPAAGAVPKIVTSISRKQARLASTRGPTGRLTPTDIDGASSRPVRKIVLRAE